MILNFTFTIELPPRTKKNSMQLISVGGRPRIIQSKAFREYQERCGVFMPHLDIPICGKINIKAVYYMPTRRKVDITNLHGALHDILVHYRIIADDSADIVLATDGSRVKYDKVRPRTEITITETTERNYKER